MFFSRFPKVSRSIGRGGRGWGRLWRAGALLLLFVIGAPPIALGQVKEGKSPLASGNAPPATAGTVQTSQPAQPAGAVAAVTPATRPATTQAAQDPPRLVISGDVAGGVIKVSLAGKMPNDLASVTFEAFDEQDYRVSQVVLLVKEPWQGELKIRRAGTITVEATIRRLGGDPDPPVRAAIQVVEPKK